MFQLVFPFKEEWEPVKFPTLTLAMDYIKEVDDNIECYENTHDIKMTIISPNGIVVAMYDGENTGLTYIH